MAAQLLLSLLVGGNIIGHFVWSLFCSHEWSSGIDRVNVTRAVCSSVTPTAPLWAMDGVQVDNVSTVLYIL